MTEQCGYYNYLAFKHDCHKRYCDKSAEKYVKLGSIIIFDRAVDYYLPFCAEHSAQYIRENALLGSSLQEISKEEYLMRKALA